MSEPAFDPTLLAQRIDQLERENTRLREQADDNTAAINKSEGRNGIMSAALPILIAVGGMVFGTVIYTGLQSTSSAATTNTIELAKLTHQIQENESTILNVRTRKIAHEQLHGHPGLSEEVATINTRLEQTEKQITGMIDEDKKSNEDRTKLSGLVERAMLLISQNTKDTEAAREKSSSNERAISAMASSVEGHLREVETQIRSINEVYNVRWQGMRSLLAIIYEKTFGKDLPEEDYFPQNIPASATNELGKIQTNGH